ncbi:MAG: hypothetical protein M0T75_03540 [Chloroflexi bacterium]|nr:hypothetical protein [Chloroflexota bacterium]
MNALATAGWTVRVVGLVMLVLGLLIWANVATGIVAVHTLLGLVLLAALWTTAGLALRAGSKPVLVVVAVAWGLLMVAFGMTQAQIAPGDLHVVVQVAHLLIGLVAIGLGEALVGAGRRGAAAAA